MPALNSRSPCLRPATKLRAHRGRRAEQIEQQPGMALEVADQVKIRVGLVANDGAAAGVGPLQYRPGRLRHGKIVVHARNGLHAPAVTMREAIAVYGLGAPEVGVAVLSERNVIVGRQAARHAGAPQQFVAHVAVDNLVDFGELGETGVNARVHAGDQFQLGLAEIGGDVRVRERRAEPGRMRRIREHAVRTDAQAFLFDSAPEACEYLARKCA